MTCHWFNAPIRRALLARDCHEQWKLSSGAIEQPLIFTRNAFPIYKLLLNGAFSPSDSPVFLARRAAGCSASGLARGSADQRWLNKGGFACTVGRWQELTWKEFICYLLDGVLACLAQTND